MGRERLMHAFKNARLIDCIYYPPHFSSSFKIKYGDRTDENTERPIVRKMLPYFQFKLRDKCHQRKMFGSVFWLHCSNFPVFRKIVEIQPLSLRLANLVSNAPCSQVNVRFWQLPAIYPSLILLPSSAILAEVVSLIYLAGAGWGTASGKARNVSHYYYFHSFQPRTGFFPVWCGHHYTSA